MICAPLLAVHQQSVIATKLAILAILVQEMGTGLLHAGIAESGLEETRQ